jgi:hypothetical protein
VKCSKVRVLRALLNITSKFNKYSNSKYSTVSPIHKIMEILSIPIICHGGRSRLRPRLLTSTETSGTRTKTRTKRISIQGKGDHRTCVKDVKDSNGSGNIAGTSTDSGIGVGAITDTNTNTDMHIFASKKEEETKKNKHTHQLQLQQHQKDHKSTKKSKKKKEREYEHEQSLEQSREQNLEQKHGHEREHEHEGGSNKKHTRKHKKRRKHHDNDASKMSSDNKSKSNTSKINKKEKKKREKKKKSKKERDAEKWDAFYAQLHDYYNQLQQYLQQKYKPNDNQQLQQQLPQAQTEKQSPQSSTLLSSPIPNPTPAPAPASITKPTLISKTLKQNPKLQQWIHSQNKYINLWEEGVSSPLNENQIQKLNNIQFFDMFSTKWDIIWNERFMELYDFYHLHGHLNVYDNVNNDADINADCNDDVNIDVSNDADIIIKENNEDENNNNEDNNNYRLKRLKEWMIHQRQQYAKYECNMNTTEVVSNLTTASAQSTSDSKSNSKSTLTLYRIKKLESIGFQWELKISKSQKLFEIKLKQLQDYKDKYGDLRIPTNHALLGRWVTRQRCLYQDYYRGRGDDDDNNKNDDGVDGDNDRSNLVLGIESDGRNDNYHDDKKKLASTSLIKEQIEALEKLGFEWKSTLKGSAFNNIWEKRFEMLCSYKKSHGHCNVSKNDKNDQVLGTWVRNQRAQYWSMRKGKKSPMTIGRMRQLESIGFKWKLRKK